MILFAPLFACVYVLSIKVLSHWMRNLARMFAVMTLLNRINRSLWGCSHCVRTCEHSHRKKARIFFPPVCRFFPPKVFCHIQDKCIVDWCHLVCRCELAEDYYAFSRRIQCERAFSLVFVLYWFAFTCMWLCYLPVFSCLLCLDLELKTISFWLLRHVFLYSHLPWHTSISLFLCTILVQNKSV